VRSIRLRWLRLRWAQSRSVLWPSVDWPLVEPESGGWKLTNCLFDALALRNMRSAAPLLLGKAAGVTVDFELTPFRPRITFAVRVLLPTAMAGLRATRPERSSGPGRRSKREATLLSFALAYQVGLAGALDGRGPIGVISTEDGLDAISLNGRIPPLPIDITSLV
jgi:hypothetical protein